MITAIDSSVLWCLLKNENNAPEWRATLVAATLEGDLVISPVAFAEISPYYDSADAGLEDMHRLRIAYDPISPATAWEAGQCFKAYRRHGGPRTRMIPDFLIAAHAQTQADRLAATDRGYLREYFPALKLLTPSR